MNRQKIINYEAVHRDSIRSINALNIYQLNRKPLVRQAYLNGLIGNIGKKLLPFRGHFAMRLVSRLLVPLLIAFAVLFIAWFVIEKENNTTRLERKAYVGKIKVELAEEETSLAPPKSTINESSRPVDELPKFTSSEVLSVTSETAAILKLSNTVTLVKPTQP